MPGDPADNNATRLGIPEGGVFTRRRVHGGGRVRQHRRAGAAPNLFSMGR